MTDITRVAAHCPHCGAEYWRQLDICLDCRSVLLPGPGPVEPQAGTLSVSRGADPDDSPDAGPADLFEREEHPQTILLAVLDELQTRNLVDELERSGIGARLGPTRDDGSMEILVHDFRLPDAQAVATEVAGLVWDEVDVAEMLGTGDPESPLPQDAERGTGEQALATPAIDPAGEADDGDVMVSSGPPGQAIRQAERLTEAGIDARLELPPSGSALPAGVFVQPDDLHRAREVLGLVV
jgi:hypothetical protein